MQYIKLVKIVLIWLFILNSVSVLAEDAKQDGQSLD